MLRRWQKAISEKFLYKGAMALGWAAGFFIILLAVVNFVTVVSRRSPWSGAWLMGGMEVSQLLMALCTATGLGYCWYVGGHIRIGMFRDRMGPRKKATLDSFAALFALLWVAVIIYAMFVISSTSLRILLMSGIAVAPYMAAFSIILIFFWLVLLRSFLGFSAKAFGHEVEHDGLY